MDLAQKLNCIRADFRRARSVLLAFSGGVDSSLLARIGQEELGDDLRTVTVDNGLQSSFELARACSIAKHIGLRHELITIDALQQSAVRENSATRCYACKKLLLSQLLQLAEKDGSRVMDGSHADDQEAYRPGQQAIAELGILSPLQNAGLQKSEIRQLALRLGLANWDAPASPCLATRFSYGQTLTPLLLEQVDQAEGILRQADFKEFRVRVHGDVARIEVGTEERQRFMNIDLMERIDQALRRLGFAHVSLDLRGFRSGSMDHAMVAISEKKE